MNPYRALVTRAAIALALAPWAYVVYRIATA
jgi:hypothetical protein